MRQHLVLGSVLALLLAAVVSVPAAGAAPTGGYIVVFKDSVRSPSAVAAPIRRGATA